MRPKSKIMVFWVFPREKMVLGRKTGFGEKNQLFLREKMVLGRKTNFSLGKTPKKNILDFSRIVFKKMVLLVFCFGFA